MSTDFSPFENRVLKRIVIRKKRNGQEDKEIYTVRSSILCNITFRKRLQILSRKEKKWKNDMDSTHRIDDKKLVVKHEETLEGT
jgi:hypothetical protein